MTTTRLLPVLLSMLLAGEAGAALPDRPLERGMPFSPAWAAARKARQAFERRGRSADPGFAVLSQAAAVAVDLDVPGFVADITVGLTATQETPAAVYFYLLDPSYLTRVTVGGVDTAFYVDQGVTVFGGWMRPTWPS
jgi:hypothetical protein